MMLRRVWLAVVLSLGTTLAAADNPLTSVHYDFSDDPIDAPLVRPVGPCLQATYPHAQPGDIICYGEMYWPPRPPIDWARWLTSVASIPRDGPGRAALRVIAIARAWYTN